MLGGSRNVAVVVHDPHSCETGNLYLESDVLGHVGIDIGLFGGVCSVRGSTLPVDETLVANFINHLLFIINNFINYNGQES